MNLRVKEKEVIDYLKANQSRWYTTRKLAKMLGTSEYFILCCLKKLETDGWHVQKDTRGGKSFWSVSDNGGMG